MKRALRRAIRPAFRIPVRGRHRTADLLGRLLAPPFVEEIAVDGIPFPVDFRIGAYRLMYYGMYEPENVSEIREVVRPGDTCIDIGANVGYITAIMAGAVGPTGRVFSFEAAPTCVTILDFLDGVPQVEVVAAAVTDHSGTARFHETDRILTMGYGYLSDIRGWSDSTESEVVVWSLDDFCRARDIDHVRYLKIDVEGAESLVLCGGAKLIRERRASYILTELSAGDDETARAGDEEVRRLLTDAGYAETRRSGRDVVWQP